MAFIETPRFPEKVSYGAMGGPLWQTTITRLRAGYESRNQDWAAELRKYDVAHGVKTQAQLDELYAFWLAVAKGRLNTFRVKDWTDYLVTTANGLLGAGIGTGLPSYPLAKRYTAGAYTHDRPIKKPVAGSSTVYRNAVAVAFGAGAGQIALDTTTGTATFVADATASASSITVGATTQVVLATNPGTLTGGQKLYLSGFSGADAALVNNLAHTINSVTGAGPYTFTLATNTAGKTITLGTGAGAKYPQAGDALTWAGEFDVPCRFDTDEMMPRIDDQNAYTWGQIPLLEVRL